MIKRVFNVLFTLCGVWVTALIWNWTMVTETEGVGPIVVVAILPFAAVFLLYYLLGTYRDLF